MGKYYSEANKNSPCCGNGDINSPAECNADELTEFIKVTQAEDEHKEGLIPSSQGQPVGTKWKYLYTDW